MSDLRITYFCDACGDEPHSRTASIPEVVAWLREQGAIDYEAAQWAYFHRDDHAIPWESKARLVVDAALPGGNE